MWDDMCSSSAETDSDQELFERAVEYALETIHIRSCNLHQYCHGHSPCTCP